MDDEHLQIFQQLIEVICSTEIQAFGNAVASMSASVNVGDGRPSWLLSFILFSLVLSRFHKPQGEYHVTLIAINGLDVSRCIFRSVWNDPEIEVVHINDLTDDKTLAHLLQYDSVHRKFEAQVTNVEGGFNVDGKFVATSAIRNPTELPWADKNVDIVLECTGVFRTEEKAGLHLQAGAKRVIISAPAKGGDVKTIVVGVNDNELSGDHKIVSNASCTTNCLAPVAKVLNDKFGIVSGLMTTVHAYTMDQRLLDAPHSDLRRARAAALSMVQPQLEPRAVALVLQSSLENSMDGHSRAHSQRVVDLVYN